MSRTYKDRPNKVRFPDWDLDFLYVGSLKRAGAKTKKKKHVDNEWHWMSTPSWWTRITMNVPQRRAGKIWQRNAEKTSSYEDIDLLDTPSVSKKPHKYYW